MYRPLPKARAAEAAGADVIVAQGAEAGGHRCFDAAQAERQQVGLFALLPAVVDAVGVPVAATGGIADPRGAARGARSWRERGSDRHGVPALSRSQDPPRLG